MAEQDISGMTFGRLTVTGKVGTTNTQGQSHWHCVCECGGETTTTAGHLRDGHSSSCGCYRREQQSRAAKTHGLTRTPEYQSWAAMRARCTNPAHKNYPLYGGVGIRICDRWNDFHLFLEDMGSKPSPKHTLDRIDPLGGYEPGNCRWAIRYVQVLNRKVRGQYGLGVTRVEYKSGLVRFKAAITHKGKKFALGSFDAPEDAEMAYLAAASRIYGAETVGSARNG